MSIIQKLEKYQFYNMGWYNRLDGLNLAKTFPVAVYNMVFTERCPDPGMMPWEHADLIYTGKGGGGKRLFRKDDKSGKRVGGMDKTSVYDRLSDHFKQMLKEQLEDIPDEKYRWFWKLKQENPDAQLWINILAPDASAPHEYLKKLRVGVSVIEIEVIEAFYDKFGDAPPMNREHNSTVIHTKVDSFSTQYVATSQRSVMDFL